MNALRLLSDPSSSEEASERHGSMRALVVAVLLICVFLLCGFPRPLHGTGIVPVVVLAVLDIALIRATVGLAFAPAHTLDERQTALRNLAHRRGFRLLGMALVLAVAIWVAGSGIAAPNTPPGLLLQVDSGVGGRFLVGVLELVAMLPTLVIGWMEPRPHRAGGWSTRATPALAGFAIVLAWLVTVAWAPVQTAPPGGNVVVGMTWRGGTCRHFAAGRIIGAGFGATVGTHVEVCWDGRRAFVVGDRGGSGAGRLLPRNNPTLTACGADSWDDFAFVSGITCTTRISGDGTLHYTFHGLVSPLPFAIGARQVSMNLVVTRSGRVLEPL